MTLSSKRIVRLERWEYHETNDPQWNRDHVLSGKPYGHPHLPDGTGVTTSRILGKRGSLVETQNTLYDLGKPAEESITKEELLHLLDEQEAR